MANGPAAALDAVTGGQDAQTEVGILAIRPREALVEATELAQDAPAVRHVGGDQGSRRERGDAPLPIGGASMRREGNLDLSLAGRDVGAACCQVSPERGAPTVA